MISSEAETSAEYGGNQIQVLEGLEAVRKRPGMYIGSTSVDGLHHLIWEIVDNSVDEALAGHCDHIWVTLQPDGGIRVKDNGRGIPVDIQPQTGRPAAEVVLTVLHAGGKFEEGGYKVSGGLHGVGSSVVNALSERLDLKVYRDGKVWEQQYTRGVPQADLVATGETDERGTVITFYPDDEIFPELGLNRDTIISRFRETCFLTPGLRITIIDERETEPVEHSFFAEGGLKDFVEYLQERSGKVPVHEDVIMIEENKEDNVIRVALRWSESYQENLLSFANNINTHDGGVHLSGFKTALTRTLNAYAKSENLMKKDDITLTGDDLREGLTAVVGVWIAEPQFEGQTKTKLGNAPLEGIVNSAVGEALQTYWEENPAVARLILNKAVISAQARDAARKAREMTRRKNVFEGGGLPGKLTDCQSKDPVVSELFVTEGDSASGSAKSARKRETQAIMPLRGKIINAEKHRLDKVLASTEVQSLISAIGAGVREEFDITKVRYHKLILASVDGEDHTFVKTLDGAIQMVSIGEWIDNQLEQHGALDPEYSKIIYDQGDAPAEVLCFDPDSGEVRFKPIKAVIRHPAEDQLLEVTTSYGRRIRITEGHSVFTENEGELELLEGRELSVGDYLAVPQSIQFNENTSDQTIEQIDILPFLHSIPEAAEQIMLRGEFVEQWLKHSIVEEYADQPQLVGARVAVSDALASTLRQYRLENPLRNVDICEAVNIGQPCTLYGWEKQTALPLQADLQRYIRFLGIDEEFVEQETEVQPSRFENLWASMYNPDAASKRNRLRSYLMLNELSGEDLRWFEGKEVQITSRKHTSTGISRYLPINEDLAFILGVYIAEGSCSDRNGIRFALGTHETAFIAEVHERLARIFGEGVITQDNGRGCTEVRIRNRSAALLWQHYFGFCKSNAETKRIPNIVWSFNYDLRQSFLRGYLMGDGTVTERGLCFSTVSPHLASGIQYLLQADGILSTRSIVQPEVINRATMKNIKEGNDKYHIISKLPNHAVSVCHKTFLEKTEHLWDHHDNADALREKLSKTKTIKHSRSHELPGDLIGVQIQKIEPIEPSNGFVYDFSVEGDETFIAGMGGVCCHNTDADSDGAHIRTLILTFLYRNMPELIEAGYVYLAKPPLYKVRIHGKDIYVENEAELEKLAFQGRYEEFQINGVPLTEAGWKELKKRSSSATNAKTSLMKTFGDTAVNGLESLGMFGIDPEAWPELLSGEKDDGRWMWKPSVVDEHGISGELIEIESNHSRTFDCPTSLRTSQLTGVWYAAEQEISRIYGAAPWTATYDDKTMITSSLPELVTQIRSASRNSLKLQRFKGLGEMNPDQLFATTMDPEKRTLTRVTINDAAEADLAFSMLMGDEVPPRKEFIQSHALEVEADV